MITIAVHTYDYALSLKSILESHGIQVKFSGLHSKHASLSAAVKININEADLPLALKIIESGKDNPAVEQRKLTGISNKLLIPVDFSDMSLLACWAGFELAERLDLSPILLYAFASPYYAGGFATENIFPDDPLGDEDVVNEMVAGRDLLRDANVQMCKFAEDLRTKQNEGSLPSVEFSTLVEEGVAEDVILQFSRTTPPALVVMATRGRHKREKEMIGSVTAEVLDSCRVPLFTVPENYSFPGIKNITRLAVFCNLDQHDILSVDTLMRMFSYPAVDIWLIPVNDRAGDDIDAKLNSLRNYFASNYPAAVFHAALLPVKSFRSDFESLVSENNLQMIVVPNKKKNILSRLFNPGIAHKLLFERDMPMLALPV